MYEYVLIPLILLSLAVLDCRKKEEEEVEKVEEEGYIERIRKDMYFQNLEY
jgi:hypothetical protein